MGPLTGYRIVDFTANMSGPLATMMLGDQGADVVKVEPPAGDPLRGVGTSRAGMSAYFANLNRNKRSLVVDLTAPAGRDLAGRLIDTADVVVENYRPAAAERFGLIDRQLRAQRPRLITAEVIGFGTSGPYAGRPVYDHVVQAVSGIAALQSDRTTGEPSLVRQGIVDKVTASVLAQGITAALLQRARTGTGCHVQVCMLDAAIAFLWPDGMMNHTMAEPDAILPAVANSFRLIPTRDGHVSLVAQTSNQWKGMLRAVEYVSADPDDDPARWTTEERWRRGGAVLKEVARRTGERSTAEVVTAMATHDVPCGEVVALEDVATHPQVAANGAVEELEHPLLGCIRQPKPAATFGRAPFQRPRPAPALGEHSLEVLGELGLSAAQIDQLLESGVVQGPTDMREPALEGRRHEPA